MKRASLEASLDGTSLARAAQQGGLSLKKKKRKEEENESFTGALSRFLVRENEQFLSIPAKETSLISFEDEERCAAVRDAVVDGVLNRAEAFFLFQNKNEEFLVPLDKFEFDDDEEDEDEEEATSLLSFAMVDIACAAVDFAEEVVRAFASGECKSESAWVYEVLSASCFRLSLKTRERRDRFDADFEKSGSGGGYNDENENKSCSVPISTITFDKETMAKMETVILTTLEYRVSKPTRATWAKEFLNAMKKNVEIVAFGAEGARPTEFKRLWTKAEEHACVIVGASLRSFPNSPQFRTSALGAAAATVGVASSAFEYLRREKKEEQKLAHRHAAFVLDVKKLVKATAVNAYDFGSWEREFETAFASFSKHHHRRAPSSSSPGGGAGGDARKRGGREEEEPNKEEEQEGERIVVS
jgi:hypothetical protein